MKNTSNKTTLINSNRYSSVVDKDVLLSIRRIFKSLDKYEDMIVDFQELITELQNSDQICPLKTASCFYVQQLNLEITVGMVLDYMVDEAAVRGVDKYVSWHEVESYFKVLREKVLKYIKIERAQTQLRTQQVDGELGMPDFEGGEDLVQEDDQESQKIESKNSGNIGAKFNNFMDINERLEIEPHYLMIIKDVFDAIDRNFGGKIHQKSYF